MLRTLLGLLFLTSVLHFHKAFCQPVKAIDSVITYRRLPPTLTHRWSRQWVIHLDSMWVVNPSQVDSPPRPLGGLEAIKRAIMDLPEIQSGSNVTIQFTIDSAGMVRDPTCLEGIWDLANALIFAVYFRTTFEPGVINQAHVNVAMRLRARFTLIQLTEIMELQPLCLSQITLQAFPGLVSGPPDFTLSIDSSGASTYEGRAGVDLIGSYIGTCPPSSFKRLEKLLRYLSFLEAPYTYLLENMYAARQQITVVANGLEVSHWANEDECNWALSLAIAEVARQIRWTKVK